MELNRSPFQSVMMSNRLQMIEVTATRSDGTSLTFNAQIRLDTPVEVEYYRNGGILHTVLRQLASTE